MTGQRDRLVAEPFHQAPIADHHVGIMVDTFVAKAAIQQALRQRHANSRGDSLPQRTCRRFDAWRMSVFGMPGRLRAPLPEGPELVERHAPMTRQIQQRIQQHRAVTGRQNEPIPVRPCRVGRVEFEEPGEQHRRHIGHPHRHTRVTGLGLLNRVDRKKANRVRHVRMRDVHGAGYGGWGLNVHAVRLLRSISCRISGVRMSCIARSSFAPWITIELARDMKLFGIIDSR